MNYVPQFRCLFTRWVGSYYIRCYRHGLHIWRGWSRGHRGRRPLWTVFTTWTHWTAVYRLRSTWKISKIISRLAHRTPNFMNPEYFVCLLFEYFFQIKVLNQYQNIPKIANITRYIKKKKNTLQHLKSGKLKFGICKIGCSMSWTR